VRRPAERARRAVVPSTTRPCVSLQSLCRSCGSLRASASASGRHGGRRRCATSHPDPADVSRSASFSKRPGSALLTRVKASHGSSWHRDLASPCYSGDTPGHRPRKLGHGRRGSHEPRTLAGAGPGRTRSESMPPTSRRLYHASMSPLWACRANEAARQKWVPGVIARSTGQRRYWCAVERLVGGGGFRLAKVALLTPPERRWLRLS